MKKTMLIAAATMMLGVATGVHAGDAHVAIVCSVDGGKVTIQRASDNSEIDGKMGMKVFENDTIVTTDSASCELVFNSGGMVTVDPKTTMKVQTQSNSGKGLSQKLAAAFFTEDEEDALSAIGGIRAVDPLIPVPLYPREATIVTKTPTFRWNTVPGAKNYVVTLTSSMGDIWTAEAPTNELPYPEDFPVLESDEFYFWQVDVVLDKTQKASQTANFEMASGEVLAEIEALRQELSARAMGKKEYFLLALAYQKNNLLHEAVEQYEKMIAKAPGESYPFEQIGSIYVAMGLKEQAIEALEKTVELDPSVAQAYRMLSVLYGVVGKQSKAKDAKAAFERLSR